MSDPFSIDVSQFQKSLASLALTMSLKVEREGTAALNAPPYVAIHIGVLLRSSNATLNLLWYLNADERTKGEDPYFKQTYIVAAFPLVRNLIDNLYNITFLLEDPNNNGRAFQLSGIRKEQRDLDEDEKRYGGKPEWDSWIAESRSKLDLLIRQVNTTQCEVDNQPDWKTLGKYLGQKGPGGSLNAHQQLLSTFMFGPWREYSALAHGAPEGLRDIGMFLARDEQPFEDRPKIDDALHRQRAMHLMRASLILLATITEIQAYFHFRDANIDSRLHAIWNPVLQSPEAKELYDERYKKLMESRGILP